MRWELLAAGLGVVALVTIVAMVLTAGGSGIWLVAFLPVTAAAGGALLLAGRDPA